MFFSLTLAVQEYTAIWLYLIYTNYKNEAELYIFVWCCNKK